MSVYKILLLGECETGKTSYMQKLFNGFFTDKYIPSPSHDTEISRLVIPTSIGILYFNIWDFSGKSNYVSDHETKTADGFIIMMDNRPPMARSLIQANINTNKSIVTVYNKCDLLTTSDMEEEVEGNIDNIYMSVKNEINLDLPILYLARKLTNNSDLTIMPPPS